MTVVTIVLSIACFIVGGFAFVLVLQVWAEKQIRQYPEEMRRAEAEVIKKNKLLEVKEKFLNKKGRLGKRSGPT